MIHAMHPSSNQGEEQRDANLWETLQILLPDMREQRLAFLLFNCGLKPREIISHCPQEFCDLQEVYRLRHNIIEQFMHHRGTSVPL